jgi:hypothetical protein
VLRYAVVVLCVACYSPSQTHWPDPEGDASTDGTEPIDATLGGGDAALCELGCPNGTCMGGVCVIDCSAPDSCPMDIHCPPNVPCRVMCGDSSCDKKIECQMATSCEVQCTGTDACADEIHCGMDKPCDITCSGLRSCKKRPKCKEACSCDVLCTGIGSCAEAAECPMGCRLGNGCTAAIGGCDRCD